MYPDLKWQREEKHDYVLMNGKPIVDLKEERYLRFTSKDGDERWIGNKIFPVDIGWGFHDAQLSDYKSSSVSFENCPEEGCFQLTMRGGKHVMECRNDAFLRGVWHEAEECFYYLYTMDFESGLENLYQHSTRCQERYEEEPQAWSDIQVFDFFIPFISLMDIVHEEKYHFPRPLYPWYVMSEDGENWVKSPKVHIPTLTPFEDREGDLCTYPTCYGQPGSYFGYADREYGGWLVHTLNTFSPISHQICWMFYDIHVHAPASIPPRGSCERVNLHYECEFIPLTTVKAGEITDSAREADWRKEKKYDVPRFSYDNRFDDSLVTLPGEKTGQINFWYQSDENCRMDHTIGYDDTDSVMIERTEEKAQPSAWYCLNWGVPYDTNVRLGRRYRMSAWVKTENCTGKARIGKVSMVWGGDIFYGFNTHYEDGEPKAKGGTFGGMDKELDLDWKYSDSVTGTSAWTQVSVEFDVLDGIVNVFLELSGTGKCWFDNVKLEELGTAERILERGDIKITKSEKETHFVEFFKDYDPMK